MPASALNGELVRRKGSSYLSMLTDAQIRSPSGEDTRIRFWSSKGSFV